MSIATFGSAFFNASYYLSNNADVVAAISRGQFTSALDHFQKFGKYENRMPNGSFNGAQYLINNPDVAQYVGSQNATGLKFSAYDHFVLFGVAEDRNSGVFSGSFNETAYLAANADVAAAVRAGTFVDGYEHYLLFGQFEGRVALNTSGTSLVGANKSNLALTPNVETVTGGPGSDTLDANAFFTANGGYVNTLNTGDNIDLGAGSDVVNLQLVVPAPVTGGGIPTYSVTPTSFKGVEALNVQVLNPNSGTLGGATLNLTNGDANLTAITVQNDGGNFTQITNAQGKIGTVNLLNTLGFVSIGVANAALSGTSDSVQVNLNGVTGGGLTIGATSATNGYETVTIASGGSVTNVLNTFGVTGIATLNINGSAGLTLTSTATTLATVDASAATGVLNLNINPLAGGNDRAQSIKLGSGNDVLNMGGSFNSADVVDGGAGSDILLITNAAAVAATGAQQVTNVETIGLTDGLNGTVAVSNFAATGFQYGATQTGAGVLNYASGTDALSFQNFGGGGNALTVNIVGTSTTDVLNITAGATGGSLNFGAGAVTLNGADTVNIATAGNAAATFGGAFTLTPTVAAVETLKIVGGTSITFNGVVTADVIDASGLTGTAALALTAGTAANAISVTGSGGNDVLITGTAGDTITAGAGNDIVDGRGGADNLTGGAGNDTFVFRTLGESRGTVTAADTNSALVDKITDFAGNGAAAGDFVQLGLNFFANVAFTGATKAAVTAVPSIDTAATFGELFAKLTAATAGTASTATTAQAYDVNVLTGNLAGHYLVVNDGTAAFDFTTDAVVNLGNVGGSATVDTSDFIFA